MSSKINFVISLLLISGSIILAQTKKIEAIKGESTITYQLTHPLHEIESTSKDAQCIIEYDHSSKIIKSVMVQVDVTTFNSGNSNRDSHAMEVIDALTYPYANFTSTSVTQNGNNLEVAGKLTFHGITKDIILAATTSESNGKLVVKGNFSISLTAFKVERPSLLMIPVKDELRFTFTQVFNI